jgi:hypothetical protein
VASFRKKKGEKLPEERQLEHELEDLHKEDPELAVRVKTELDRIMAPLQAVAEREGKTWEAFLEGWELLRLGGDLTGQFWGTLTTSLGEGEPRRLEWLALTVFGFVRQGLGLLREDLEPAKIPPENPPIPSIRPKSYQRPALGKA